MFFSCSDAFFFAVKEVSLLDDGSSQGKQSIFQLQQVGGLNLPIEYYDLFIPCYMEVFFILMLLNFFSGNISIESVSTR